MADYVCPKCKQPLTTWECKGCGLDIRDLFKGRSASNDDILQAIQAAGAYYMPATRQLVISGGSSWGRLEGCPSTWENSGKFRIWLSQELNCSINSLSMMRLDEFWVWLWKQERANVPNVVVTGRRPMLLLDENGKLYFPKISTLQSRLFHSKRTEDPRTGELVDMVTLYDGPPLTPQDHGGLFEQFLASMRCLDEDNRQVVRSWCYSVLLAHMIPEGQFPGLVVASDEYGAGKTTTAECLMEIFGGGLSLVGKQLGKIEDLMRLMMTPDTGFLLADNLRNERGQLIDNSDLAGVMTMKKLSTKKLYESAGSYTVPNRVNFLLTANQPMFSPELLSRMTCVTLRAPTPEELEEERRRREADGETRSWMAVWLDQRRRLLEDVMFHVISNWNAGPYSAPNCPIRFVDWWRVASRALRDSPVIVPRTTALYTPLQRALQLLFQGESGDRLPVEGIVGRMRAKQHGEITSILRQKTWTDTAVVKDLQLYGTQFAVEAGFVVRRY